MATGQAGLGRRVRTIILTERVIITLSDHLWREIYK